MVTKMVTKVEIMQNAKAFKPIIERLLTDDTVKSLVVKVLGALGTPRCLLLLVPEGGIEPPRAQGPLDFESSASTSFTTPA